jgi:eukaryotic-like serine/threonine-protein kinase
MGEGEPSGREHGERRRLVKTDLGGLETSPRTTKSLPTVLLRQAESRLPGLAIGVAVVLFIVWFFPNLLEGELVHELTHVMQGGPPIVVLIASVSIAALCRLRVLTGAALASVGLVYQALVTVGLVLSQYWGAFQGAEPAELLGDRVGLAPAMLFLFVYTALVPSDPRRSWIALLLSCAAVPVTYYVNVRVGLAPALPAGQFVSLFIFPNAVAFIVLVFMSRVIFRLGVDVRRAREMGSYRLEELLGRGGMGEVWRASHRMLARPAAIKLIRAEALASKQEKLNAALARFEREAQVTALLESPHTVELFDFGTTDDGSLYYVMELLDGTDLESLVTDHGTLPARRVVHVLRQVCASLAEAHERGLVHRDIKPANIFLCRRGLEHDFVKVLDFGLVRRGAEAEKEEDSGVTKTGAITGTPGFMAPEQVISKDPPDARADLYAIGCVGYWLLTGRLVFEAPTVAAVLAAHAYKAPEPPSAHSDQDVPKALDALILRCLAKDPAERPQRAEEIDAELAAIGDPWTQREAKDAQA